MTDQQKVGRWFLQNVRNIRQLIMTNMKSKAHSAVHVIMLAGAIAGLPMSCTAFAAGTLREALRDGPAGVNEFARRTKSCAGIMGNIGDQLKSDLSGLDSIDNNDYASLCRFGREVHIPARERAIETLIAAEDCEYSGDPVTKAVVDADRKTLKRMRTIIAKDCQRARMSTGSNPRSARGRER